MIKPFLLLTQDACPNCERLKKMLAGPLRGQFDEQIEMVHRESEPERFIALAEQFELRSVPVLIRRVDGLQLKNHGSLGEVKGFLTQSLSPL